jgi:hypothetical protein
MKTNDIVRILGAAALLAALAPAASAQAIPLQQGTASASQDSYAAAEAIDGSMASGSGWGIYPFGGVTQTAVFETVTDVGFAGGTVFEFALSHLQAADPGHILGRFRLSFTTDDRSSFADGLAMSGDVAATWTVLAPTFYSATSGATMTLQGDNSILVSGTTPTTDTYTIAAGTGTTGITGFRLEAIADASLPVSGPGLAPNGNFILTEFAVTATAVPEPSVYAALAGVIALGCALRRRNRPMIPPAGFTRGRFRP